MPTGKSKIVSKAVEILEKEPNGVHYSVLLGKIADALSGIPHGTIKNTIIALDTHWANQVYKPARGLFRHVKFREEEIAQFSKEKVTGEGKKLPSQIQKIREEDFYKPFSDWLVNEIEECTKAIPLGGNKFRDKWGTPDVIGKREPLRSDIVKSFTEVISAEIKSDTRDLITAFGQACSYKLFSHKSYIVVPKNSPQDDISKLDSLGLIFGIGLVLFDNISPNDPQFEIRVRPMKHDPDMFFVNKYMKLIERELFR
jgi:hypothetical protein